MNRVVLALAMSAALLFSQQPKKPAAAPPEQPEEALIKVDVDLVSILYSVRNKSGGLVPNLGKDDFTIFEDGKQQTIRNFARETDLPLTIGLLIDVSRSQENLIGVERQAASQFFSQVLRQKDMAFLISFGSEAELLQDSTSSATMLKNAMNDLRVNTTFTGIAGMPGPVPTSRLKGTILFDAVYLAANDKLKREVGRKVIVIISDGVDVGSNYDIKQAIEMAQKADAIIYSVEYVDERGYGMLGGGGGAGTLRRMSEETGGRMYRVDRKHTLHQIFEDIQNEMRSQYAIAYTPVNSSRDGAFRRIEVKVANKDMKVQARKGYYATANSGQ
ncbi:MAG: VWA domain-containing protein [Bryobacteraceae bacterium]|nr:VWA domain-containing protein [Bryobacteraceae bacterium]